MSKQGPEDINETAFRIVSEALGGAATRAKSPHAVRAGGIGGRARTERLSPERRSEIAKKAAAARWGKDKAE